MLRILLLPVVIWLYVGPQEYAWSVIVLAVATVTDFFDGKVARRFNMVSDFGKVLDPIADKLTQGSLIICLIPRYPWVIGMVIFFVIKELIMIYWGIKTIKEKNEINSAIFAGKINTVLLDACIMALFLFPGIPDLAANIMLIVCCVSMLMALILYGRFYLKVLRPNGQDKKAE